MTQKNALNNRIDRELKKEVEEIVKNPDKFKTYENLADIMADIKTDETL